MTPKGMWYRNLCRKPISEKNDGTECFDVILSDHFKNITVHPHLAPPLPAFMQISGFNKQIMICIYQKKGTCAKNQVPFSCESELRLNHQSVLFDEHHFLIQAYILRF